MNSIDAVIAMLMLLIIFGLFLSVLVNEKQNIELAEKTINTKIIASKCGVIVDGLFANSGKGFDEEINCFGNGNAVYSKNDAIRKDISVITTVKKKSGLEVKVNEHYT